MGDLFRKKKNILVIRNIQVSVVILLPFQEIGLLPVREILIFSMPENQILYRKRLCQGTGIFDGAVTFS